MYRCEFCNVVAPPGAPSHRVVTEWRPAEYPSRAKSHKHRVGRKAKFGDDPGGAGYEIAKEAVVCPACAEKFNAEQQAAREAEEQRTGAGA